MHLLSAVVVDGTADTHGRAYPTNEQPKHDVHVFFHRFVRWLGVICDGVGGGAWIHGVVRHLRDRESQELHQRKVQNHMHLNAHFCHGRPQASSSHSSVDIISAQDVDMHQPPA